MLSALNASLFIRNWHSGADANLKRILNLKYFMLTTQEHAVCKYHDMIRDQWVK